MDEQRLSVVIPAYNEEKLLPQTLQALAQALAELAEKAQVIVVDNHSTDGTAEVARHAGVEVIFEAKNQIARARNAGAARASGKFLVFLDADSWVQAQTLGQALLALESGRVCVGGALFRGETPFEGFAGWLLRFWTWVSKRCGLGGGAFLFCLREGFEAVGGFDESVYAGEEIWLVRRLKRWGKPLGKGFHLVEDPPVITSPRKGKMFGSGQLLLQFVLVMICPWVTRWRRLCWVWYHRP